MLIPLAAEIFQPIAHFIQFLWLNGAKTLPTLLFDDEQLTFQQNFQVFGNGLPADVKTVGNGIGCHRFLADEVYDVPPGGVCNGLKNVSSHVVVIYAQLIGCKYTRNRLVAKHFYQKNIFLCSLKEIGARYPRC